MYSWASDNILPPTKMKWCLTEDCFVNTVIFLYELLLRHHSIYYCHEAFPCYMSRQKCYVGKNC